MRLSVLQLQLYLCRCGVGCLLIFLGSARGSCLIDYFLSIYIVTVSTINDVKLILVES